MQKSEQKNINDVIKMAKSHNKKSDSKIIKKAYEYAYKAHGDQKRKSGEPYIIHPLEVAYILADLGMDDHTICAGLMHDLVEDTEVTLKDIEEEFNTEISEMVDGVTKLGKLSYNVSAEEQQVENYRKMFLAMGKDIRVILIKLSDRLHNMRTLKYLKRDRQIANAKETIELYAPLANRLGMYSLKWELEDLSFKYLHPEEYREIVEGINRKREERLRFIEQIMDEIKVQLRKNHIVAEVTGRAKHLYSIYRKMQRDNKTLDQIYDLFALRILVNSVKDCYASLGIVHDLYTPMPGRFKDYISVPKPNMYQSLHTTLIGKKGTPFEVQIRTYNMHRVAEFGIAAHWAYKEHLNATSGKKTSVVVTDDKLAWLRESLEWQKDMQDPKEFMETLKTELFEDEVYVFTPRGEIKTLPKGSTPIDFAYLIHAEIGNKMVGCKINSKMMPIITKLKNGDIVDIITSDNSKGPSRDWLRFVKSSNAKTKILQWFKKHERGKNIEKGRDLIEKEIKRIGMPYDELFIEKYYSAAINRYRFKDLEDMYAAIGFGSIGAGKIIARTLEEYRKYNKEKIDLEDKIEKLHTPKKVKGSDTGIVVKGIDNCLIKISKCCNPVPGDEIIGYITRGRGVTIHRKNCINVKDLLKDEGRIIEVEWNSQNTSSYSVDISIQANDRDDLLADVVKVISNSDATLISISARANREKIATIEMSIDVKDLELLNKVLRALGKVDSVYEVKRTK